MKKLKLIWLVLLIICWVGSVFAQKHEKKPNFSGVWKLNLSKSKPDELTRNSFADGEVKKMQMKIVHQGLKLSITDFIKFENSNSNEDFENTYQFITDEKIRQTKRKDSQLENSDDLYYQALWVNKKLLIKLFIKENKNSKRSLFGTIEFTLSENKQSLFRSAKTVEEASFNGSRMGNSIMVYDLSDK